MAVPELVGAKISVSLDSRFAWIILCEVVEVACVVFSASGSSSENDRIDISF